jgi:ABC-2 type transport system permease protein
MAELGSPRQVWLLSVVLPKLWRLGRGSAGQRITRLFFVLVGLLIAYGLYRGSVWFLQLAYKVEVIGPLLCQRLLDMVLLIVLSVLLLSNIVTALSSFFLAKDLDLLVTAPIPPRSLFAARFLEQLVHSSWMALAFGAPILLAFVKVLGTPLSYLAVAATLPPLLVLPAALGAVLTMLLVSSLPAARARDILVAMLFIGFIVLYLVLRLVEPERFLNPEGFASMVSFLASFSSPSGGWLPSRWGAEAIAATFRDHAGGGRPWLLFAALWTGAGAAWVIASTVFRVVYIGAYSRSQQGRKVARLSRLWARLRGRPLPEEGRIRAPGRRGAESDWLRAAGSIAPRGPTREFIIKDLKLLLRDASQWSQLVLLLALVFVYLYNFSHFRRLGDSGLIGPLAIFLLGLALSGFVTTAVSVRFAFPLISMEGRMLWLLRSAPIPARQILRAKLLSTLPPLLVVAELMSIASSWILGQPPLMMLLSAIVALFSALAVASIATGVGALMPDYRAESAAKVAASFGGLVCMSVAMLAAFAMVAWAAYPAYLIHYGRSDRLLTFVLCGVGALVTLAIAIWLPLYLGGRALERQEP